MVVLSPEISWPNEHERATVLCGSIPEFPNAIGHIDGAAHRRNRPGHRQSAYYRGDKKCHFITSQVTVDHSGLIRNIETGFAGHNQDQGIQNFI